MAKNPVAMLPEMERTLQVKFLYAMILLSLVAMLPEMERTLQEVVPHYPDICSRYGTTKPFPM